MSAKKAVSILSYYSAYIPVYGILQTLGILQHTPDFQVLVSDPIDLLGVPPMINEW